MRVKKKIGLLAGTAVFKVPSKKLKAYQKLLKKKG